MKRLTKASLLIATLLFTSGCDFFKGSTKSKMAEVVNYEDNITNIKEFKVKDDSSLEFNLGSNIDYIKKLNGLDASLFQEYNNSIKLTIKPNYNNPEDSNGDNIYEVKLYAVDSDKNDYIILLKIEIENNSSGNEDNNNTNGGGSDNNNSNGNGGDNNNTGGGDNNSTNGGGDNNNTNGGGDNNNTNGGGDNNNTTVNLDIDNDYIPNDIEELLGKDSNNSDENSNNIVDGLEGDPLLSKEWYIKAEGTPTNPSGVSSIVGNDLNIFDVYKSYMGYNKGEPIILQIVDSGIDIEHEDLKDNIDLSRSLDDNETGNPMPGGFFRPHGTMLAGIAAARGFNGVGVRGVAPFAKIAGSNWLATQTPDALEAAWLTGNGANEIAVTNNSWGRYYTIDTIYEDIMQEGSEKLRDGKGRVYVFASGNARSENADSNIQYILNNRYALVVGALNIENKVASYSTAGANVWISAYGGADDFNDGPTIATTYISGESTNTWAEDTNKNYTYAMAGSSAAAPMVTGGVALILEACPNLGYRDVKYILAKSAKQVDTSNSSWVTNSAGLHFSRDYGFGLIDTKKAIEICKNNYNNLGALYTLTSSKEFTNKTISGSETISINVEYNHKVEWIEATIDLDTQNASDYDISLISPSGTKVLLVKHGTKIDAFHIPNGDWMKNGFRLSTGAFLDEDSLGNWAVEIKDSKNNTAILNSIELKIYTH